MNALLWLLIQSIVSIALSLVVLRVISGPLLNTLAHICPDAQAAEFWLSYTKVMLTLAPLLLVLTADMLARFSDPMNSVRLGLLAALGGLLIGAYSIGQRVGQFVVRPETARSVS